MATCALSRDSVDLKVSLRTLILVWQNPDTRRFVRVGQVDALPGGRVAFQYLSSAWEDPAFHPLIEYPDAEAVYVSDVVPAFFANRILSTARPNYDQYLDWLGLDGSAPEEIPFEVLARTGGGRATDLFHVVDLPIESDEGFLSRFFVSGIRYGADSGEVVAALARGDDLRLELDPNNPVNPKAVLINTTDNRQVGYVPDWLCADIHDRLASEWDMRVVVERVNPEAPAHVQVLCRIEANRSRRSR